MKNYKPKTWYIQLIHIAKSQLDMDDEYYRLNLHEAVKKQSCADMSLSELVQVLEHFKKLGFKPKSIKKQSPKSSNKKPSEKNMLDKLRQIWIEMHKQGFINDGSEQALEKWAINQSKRLNKGAPVAKLEWTSNQMRYALIEQLKKWHVRLLQKALPEFNKSIGDIWPTLCTAHARQIIEVQERLTNAPETQQVLTEAFNVLTTIINDYKGTANK